MRLLRDPLRANLRPVVVGEAIRFPATKWADGQWRTITREAFRLEDNVQALVCHEPRLRLGSTNEGTLRLRLTDEALHVTLWLPDSPLGHDTYHRLLAGLSRPAGVVNEYHLTGWSVNGTTSYRPDGTSRVYSMFEVSLASRPALPNTLTIHWR